MLLVVMLVNVTLRSDVRTRGMLGLSTTNYNSHSLMIVAKIIPKFWHVLSLRQILLFSALLNQPLEWLQSLSLEAPPWR